MLEEQALILIIQNILDCLKIYFRALPRVVPIHPQSISILGYFLTLDPTGKAQFSGK